MEDLAREHIPPLQPIDIIGILAIDTFQTLYSKQVVTSQSDHGDVLGTRDTNLWNVVALLHVMRGHDDLALAAGLYPTKEMSDGETIRYAFGRYYEWQKEFFYPACMDAVPTRRKLDVSKREDRVAFISSRIMADQANTAGFKYLTSAVDFALRDLGHRDEGDPALTPEDVQHHLHLVAIYPQKSGELVHRGRSGTNYFGKRQLRDILEEVIGPGTQRSVETRRKLDKEESPNWVDDDAEVDTETTTRIKRKGKDIGESAMADEREMTPDDAVAVREFREELEQRAGWPALRRVLGVPKLAAKLPVEASGQIRTLLDLIERHRDPSLRAAILYEWATHHIGRFSGGRELIGREFDVTARQIERRGAEARFVLATVVRAG